MTLKKSEFPILCLGDGTLQDRIYTAVRKAILDGSLRPGARLPSSRALSEEASVSRNTVTLAFDRLTAEGYLVGKVGSGTYVSQTLPDDLVTVERAPRPRPNPAPPPAKVSRNLIDVLPLWRTCGPGQPSPAPFAVGIGAVDEFPHDAWGRLLGRQWRRSRTQLGNGVAPAGHPHLRKVIGAYVRASRGIVCSDEQILVVNGTQQAISLTARVLLNAGDEIWLDDPGYNGARGAFLAVGARVRPVGVDADGMDVSEGKRLWPDAKLAFTAPSCQFPLGATLSLPRRLELLEWAALNEAWIFEDDYNSEFRYSGRPLQALQGLDRHGRVIYAGTFTKMMFPGLRLGFLVVPPSLVEAFLAARYFADAQSSLLEQGALAEFISGGLYARHVRRVRRVCADRQAVLLAEARKHLGGVLEIEPMEAGIHVVGRLPEGYDDMGAAEECRANGLNAHALSCYSAGPSARRGLILGYAAHPLDDLCDGVRRLARILRGFHGT